MRIPIVDVLMNEDRAPVLVKKQTRLYKDLQRIRDPKDVARIMTDVFQMDRQITEVVYLIALDNKGMPLGFFFLNQGVINRSQVDVRGIFIRLLLTNAANFILVHNHTSGEEEPSKADFLVTKNIRKMSELMDVEFCDHIIIGDGRYFSFLKEVWSKKKTVEKSEIKNESEEKLCLQN